ncbi:acetylornithine transaminase [Arenibaculum sp.]|uniref:acetylornithine transaminase n=1 Tax=Arenibaculum sp. TaxID=2865862 RepID=UPI002E12A3E8|nr:acetylornithine transaminase [Arenibaculum sp.]
MQETSALMNVAARPPVIFERGEGSWLFDTSGRRYLDFIQGWAVNALGHCPDTITEVLAEQGRRLISPSPAFFNDKSAALAQFLAEKSCCDQAFFTSSGAEANEGAIKLARKYGSLHRGGAYEIVTFDGGFHGRTLATMSASGKPAFAPLFEPKVPGFPKARLNDIDSVLAAITDKTVAVMLEPIQGEAGVVPATARFLQDLRTLTRDKGLLLILDEVQTGIGRTGALFAYEHAGIEPDIMTLGKGIGGGVPLGAVLAQSHASCFQHGDQGGTYSGNPLMCAVGLAVARRVAEDGFLAGVRDKGRHLVDALEALGRRHGLGGVRGAGLLLALDLGKPVSSEVAKRAFDAGLLLNAPRPDTLRFMPALTVSTAEIDEMVAILEPIIASVR